MAVIKRKNDKGKFRYQVRVKGHRAKTCDTLSEARKHEGKLLNSKPKRGGSMTAERLADHWLGLFEAGKLNHQRGKPPKHNTLAARKQHLTAFKDEFGARHLDDLDPLEVEKWATQHRWAIRTVAPLVDYAVTKRLAERNEFAQYGPRKGPGRKLLEPLTDQQLADLAEAAETACGPNMKAFVLWQAFEGLRPGESYALDWPLDLTHDELRIDRRVYNGIADSPKTGARDILLLPQAIEALQPIRGIKGPVFQTVWGKRFSNQTMSTTYWPKVRKEFGQAVDIYELRHYCAHLLYVRMDLPARVVARQLGNSPRMIEDLYGHFRSGPLDELRERVKLGVPVELSTKRTHERSETA